MKTIWKETFSSLGAWAPSQMLKGWHAQETGKQIKDGLIGTEVSLDPLLQRGKAQLDSGLLLSTKKQVHKWSPP